MEDQRVKEKLRKKLEEIKNRTCCFAGCYNDIGVWGNNPSPFQFPEGRRCCDQCNFYKVLPLRVMEGKRHFENNLKKEKMI